MRGKVTHRAKHHPAKGITPAYAGKSVPDSVIVNFVKDHPRLCGEKSADAARHPSRTRITPAYAGKRVALHLHIGFRRDHPRLCGEKPDWDGLDKTAQGSPPPMRGKARGNNIGSHWIRITPAYAGKSMQQKEPACCRKDHPRLCGEKIRRHLLY